MNTITMTTIPTGSTAGAAVAIRIDVFDGGPVRTNSVINSVVPVNYTLRGLNFFTNPIGSVFSVGALLDDPTNPSNTLITTLAPVSVLPDTCYEVTWVIGGFPNNAGWFYGATTDPNSDITLVPAMYWNITLKSQKFVRRIAGSELSYSFDAPIGPFPVYVQTLVASVGDTANITYSTEPCCVSEECPVATQRGWIRAGDVRSGDRVFVNSTDSVVVHHNVQFTVPAIEFIEIKSEPANLLIKGNHPILENGHEVLAQDCKNATLVRLASPKRICTIVTENREFVNIAGQMVATWSEAAFQNFVQHDQKGQNLGFSFL